MRGQPQGRRDQARGARRRRQLLGVGPEKLQGGKHAHSPAGFWGRSSAACSPKKADEAIFEAKVGDLAGPFVENGCCTLYKIDAIRDADLTDTMRREIADRIFAAWLHKAIDETRFESPK